MIRSPFFYVGDKYKLMNQLIEQFPSKINNYYEPFCGGGSSFLNVNAKQIYANDINKYIINIHQLLTSYKQNKIEFFNKVKQLEDNYNLSASYRQDSIPKEFRTENPKTYYAKFNKSGYSLLKKDYNKNKSDYLLLYMLLIYGFNRMIRFNKSGDFNLPVGNVDLNKNVIQALENYFVFSESNNVIFSNLDYLEFLNNQKFEKDDFVYLDPPYLISSCEYNKLWSVENEIKMLEKLDKLNELGVKFAISNLINHKGTVNSHFEKWAQKYKIVEINSNYISCFDNTKKINSREVLVKNYE